MALRSSARMHFRKQGGLIGLVAGAVCAVLSIVHLLRATGGFGTGSGKLGAIVALVLGVTGILLGSMALTRYKKMTQNNQEI
jgi:hypothetical protein